MDNMKFFEQTSHRQYKGPLLSNEYAIEKNLTGHACKNYQRIA